MKAHSAQFLFPASLLLPVILAGATPAQAPRPRFLTPTQMPAPINATGASSYSMALSADGLQAIVETDRSGGRDLYELDRATLQSPFTSRGALGFCEDNYEGGGIWIDGSTVLFSSNRPGGAGGQDLYCMRRTIVGWIANPGYAALNSPWDDAEPSLSSDGLEIFFTSNRPGSLGGRSIWHARRTSVLVDFAPGSAVLVGGVDSVADEQSPSLSDDGLWLFFSSNRAGSQGFDIHVAGRSSPQAPFGAPVRAAELSGPNHDIGIELAPRDTAAMVTVLANGRAVILSAARE
jgi:Tol biopolymer transport system component